MINFKEVQNNFKIDMVEITKGCPESCLHCGAYPNFDPNNLKITAISKQEMKKYFTKTIYKNKKIFEYFNKYITTHVNSEPLRSDAFINFAKLTTNLTNGQSQVIAISHGLQVGIPAMRKRLKAIVKLILQKKIPKFILTMDHARLRGKIDPKFNYLSYLETISVLKKIIKLKKLTISIQGIPDKENNMHVGKTEEMFEKIKKELRLTKEDIRNITIDNRSYTNTGRTKNFLNVKKSEDCDVIPDKLFIKNNFLNKHKWRGIIRFNGSLYIQKNRPTKTYGDSVNEKLWQKLA